MNSLADSAIDHRALTDALTQRLKPATARAALAAWQLATSGTDAARSELVDAKRSVEEIYLDPFVQEQVAQADATPSGDPVLDRQVRRLALAVLPRRCSAALRDEIVQIEAELAQLYSVHRGTIRGRAVSAADVQQILDSSADSTERKLAWEASKSVGEAAGDAVLAVVRLRNEVARAVGFRDHYALALHCQELSEARLFATLTKLERATRASFRARKGLLDAELSRRFDVPMSALRPWHYDDPFFQRVHESPSPELTRALARIDVVDAATRFFDGLAMNVRPILDRSDLWPRPAKDQHAFCTHIDGAGDVRILCNLTGTERWLMTLLHELGHAAYERYMAQPWLLARPAHTLTTEAVAMLMGRQTAEIDFLTEHVGLDTGVATAIAPDLRRAQQLRMLTFVRWALVMVHFERALYADPDRADLNAHWWELVSRYQLVDPPPDRDAPDWAAKIHLATAPVYYHNYVYGELLASQLKAGLAEASRSSGLVDNLAAGELLIRDVFRHGASLRWDVLVEAATGEPLDHSYFVSEFGASD